MNHVHGTPSLDEIELPTKKGTSVNFWNGEDQYSISAYQDYAWGVFGPAGRGSMRRRGDFSQSNDGFRIDDERRGPVPAGDDWRKIVRDLL